MPLYPFLGEGSPTKLDYRRKGTLPASLLEDLEMEETHEPALSALAPREAVVNKRRARCDVSASANRSQLRNETHQGRDLLLRVKSVAETWSWERVWVKAQVLYGAFFSPPPPFFPGGLGGGGGGETGGGEPPFCVTYHWAIVGAFFGKKPRYHFKMGGTSILYLMQLNRAWNDCGCLWVPFLG